MYQDRFFHVLRLTGDFDKLGFAHASITTQTRRRECIRAAKRWTQMYCSDGRAAWAAVNGLKRKQCAAKRCTCCVGTGVRIGCSQPKPVLRKCIYRSDGTFAAAMDGHTWAAVNGRKYKRVVDFASFGRHSNLCDVFASVGRDSNLCDKSASEQRRDGPTCAASMDNTRRTAVISLYYVVVGMQTSSCEQTRSSCVTSCEQTDAAHL